MRRNREIEGDKKGGKRERERERKGGEERETEKRGTEKRKSGKGKRGQDLFTANDSLQDKVAPPAP